jgi:hypothetical protein
MHDAASYLEAVAEGDAIPVDADSPAAIPQAPFKWIRDRIFRIGEEIKADDLSDPQRAAIRRMCGESATPNHDRFVDAAVRHCGNPDFEPLWLALLNEVNEIQTVQRSSAKQRTLRQAAVATIRSEARRRVRPPRRLVTVRGRARPCHGGVSGRPARRATRVASSSPPGSTDDPPLPAAIALGSGLRSYPDCAAHIGRDCRGGPGTLAEVVVMAVAVVAAVIL